MAEQVAHDVVKEAQSMGASSSVDDIAISSTSASAGLGQASNQLENNDYDSNRKNRSRSNSDSESATRPTDPIVDLAALAVEAQGAAAMRDMARSPLGEKALFLAEASGGSDTDSSRPDQSKDAGSGHARSNSVKKPTSFKSVSVTKNFLAKTAVATPNARPGEKGTASGQSTPSNSQTPKPRLVAKSALGGSGTRSGLSTVAGGAGSGPDASKVWNKNRPLLPAASRQFTDEELKQQYGIHMATRLQADEAGKESKWADIDDDEEDWAPDTVEWMDGTKSTVAPAETAPPLLSAPTLESAPSLVLAEEAAFADVKDDDEEADLVKSLLTPSTQQPGTMVSTASTTKAILKPGVLVQTQSKPGGLVLRSGQEKSGLVSKSPAQTPSKSPWAALPPVDKVTLVIPPVQPPSHFARNGHGFESMPPAPSPQEIHADDFNRNNWRDDRGTKELFNSQSGRFEPANEARRGSLRNEQGHRQPAVLQRPMSNQGGPGGPAEPSPAFQTSRSSADNAPWSRHRAGSNVSAGSGGRRMSFTRPTDLHDGMSPTDGSMKDSPQQRAAFLDRGPVQSGANRGSWVRPPPPGMAQGQPALDTPIEGESGANGDDVVHEQTSPPEDPVALQARLMREKIEKARMAKQKQLEDEQREVEARQERLRLKMEALAAASPSPPVEAKESKLKEVPTSAIKSPRLQQKQLPLTSPPKPPIPTSEGEVAQYGMMKVHQPHPVKKTSVTESSLMGRSGADASQESRRAGSSPSHHSQRFGSNQRGAVGAEKAQQKGAGDPKRGSNFELLEAAPWKAAGAEGYVGWSNSGGSSSSSNNVWGPPQSKDRALGNGTFEITNFNRMQRPLVHGPATQAQSQSQANHPPPPGPIAPPTATQHSRFSPQTASAKSVQPDGTVVSDASAPSMSTAGPVQSHMSVQQPGAGTAKPSPQDHRYTTADWASLPDQIADREKRQASDFMAAARMRQGRAQDQQTSSATIQHTFKRTGLENAFGARKVYKQDTRTIVDSDNQVNETLINGSSDKNSRSPSQAGNFPLSAVGESALRINAADKQQQQPQQLHAPAMALNSSQTSHTSSTARVSRFFPQSDASHPSAKSNSPPPPEHSSLDCDRRNPVVNLPKPQAVVKLPPASPSSQNKSAAGAPSTVGNRLGAQRQIKNTNWQARFAILLGRETNAPSPSGPHEVATTTVDSSSKAPLEVATQASSATVSLPLKALFRSKPFPFATDSSADPQSKTLDEELYPPPEFASTPTIRLPKNARLYAHIPEDYPVSPQTSRHLKQSDLTSKAAFDIGNVDQRYSANTLSIFIRVPGQDATKTVYYQPRSNSGNGGRPGGPRKAKRDGHDSQQNSRGGRKASGAYSPREGQSSSPRSTSGRGAGSWSYRGGNASWGKRTSSAPSAASASASTSASASATASASVSH